MTNSSEVRADENFALQLLRNYLSEHVDLKFQCKVNANDPPDLIVTWESGEQWGVEVTQTHQHVASIDRTKVVSSASIEAALRRFGEELGEMTEEIRKRDYFLTLWPDSLRKKEETKRVIWQHIASGEVKRLYIYEEVWLNPRNPGNRWTVRVSPGVAEIPSTTEFMLWRAFRGKTKGLPRWNGDFDQRWLLLLNCYPLASDIDDMKEVLRDFAGWSEESVGFDGVFWSGDNDRTLIPISLSESL